MFQEQRKSFIGSTIFTSQGRSNLQIIQNGCTMRLNLNMTHSLFMESVNFDRPIVFQLAINFQVGSKLNSEAQNKKRRKSSTIPLKLQTTSFHQTRQFIIEVDKRCVLRDATNVVIFLIKLC